MSHCTANTKPIAILTYHQIADAPPKGAPFRSLMVSPANFSRQMAALKLFGYTGLSMTDLMPYLRGERSGKVVGITFDDGYLNNLIHALPVLRSHNFTSTCYCVSQMLGQTNVWDRELGVAQVELMSTHHLRHWVSSGQEVGAHSRHHVHLSQMDDQCSALEVSGSKSELEQATGATIKHFCYPYGDFSRRDEECVNGSGYASATTTARGRCHAGDRFSALPRVPMLRTTPLAVMWMKVASGYEDRRRR